MGTGYIGITLLKSIVLVVSGWNLINRKRLENQNIKKKTYVATNDNCIELSF